MKQNTDPFKRFERNGPVEGPHVLLLSGVHGDEYEPMVACKKAFRKLKGKLLRGKVTFVPNVNPTAYQNGSRYGDDGLDLARICPGKNEGTPSERAAYAISELINTADYLIDMHTGGVMYDIFPLAGYMLHADSQILKKQRQMARAWRLPLVWGTDSAPDGRTLSVAREAGVPAIYLEYGGGTGFRKKVVEAYVAGFFNFLKSLKMIPGQPEFLAETEYYHVEDARQDSGYLQGKMPSPAEGIFIPKAKIGQQIKKGDQWGKITDPVTGQSSVLFADTDGLVFLQRNLIKVKQGDALGGILPIIRPGRIFIDLGRKKNQASPLILNDESVTPESDESPEKTNTST